MTKKGPKNQPKRSSTANAAPAEKSVQAASIRTDSEIITATTTTRSTPANTCPETQAARQKFREFIEIANLETIKIFLSTTFSVPESENLELLWDRAFEEGYDAGRRKLLSTLDKKLDEADERGYERGVEESKIKYFKMGLDDGHANECSEWIKNGHGQHCFMPVVFLENIGVQTDPAATPTPITTQTDPLATPALCDMSPPPLFSATSSNITENTPCTSSVDVSTQTNHLEAISSTTSDSFAQTNHFSIQKSCQLIQFPPSFITPPRDSTATTRNQNESVMSQHLKNDPPTRMNTSHSAALSGNGKNAKISTIATSRPSTGENSQNRTEFLPKTVPVISITHLTSTFTQTEHLKQPKPENATNTYPEAPPLTGFEKATGFDNGFVNSPSHASLDPVAPNGTVLGHETWSKESGLTQKQPKLTVFNQNCPETHKTLISERFNWADDAEAPQTTLTTHTKHPRDLSGLRSSSMNPFSSLRRRCRNRRKPRHFSSFRHQSNCQHIPLYPHNCYSSNPRAPHQNLHCQWQHPVSTPLHWDQDPRLADLSKALHALGWV